MTTAPPEKTTRTPVLERSLATTYPSMMKLLQQVSHDTRVRDELVKGDSEDLLTGLRVERQGLRTELERVNSEIRAARTFTTETSGYEREVKEQRSDGAI